MGTSLCTHIYTDLLLSFVHGEPFVGVAAFAFFCCCREALARVEDDLLLLQELQARYSSAQSSEWGDDLQQRQLQRLVPLNLMPCMSQRIHLQNFKGPSGNTQEEEECEQWARTLHQVLLRQITARGNPTQD